jgi:hypothetical protein
MRRRAVKVRKDQRDPEGHYMVSERDELNDSSRDRAIAFTLRGDSVLGLQAREPPNSKLSRLEYAEAEALRLRAIVHETDAAFRAEVIRVEQRYKKMLRFKERLINELEAAIADLEREAEEHKTTVAKQDRIIESLTTALQRASPVMDRDEQHTSSTTTSSWPSVE